jgi:beta-glucosidase
MNHILSTIRSAWLMIFCIFLIAILGLAIFFVMRQLKIARVYQEARRQLGECHNKDLPYRNSALPVETRVSDLLGRMTTDEKIGQLALVEKNSIKDPGDVQEYKIGALLSGGGGNPAPNTPQGWREMVGGFESSSKKSCLEIPLIYGVDAVHGHGSLPSATIFPHSIGLGATNDIDLVRRVAAATAQELAAIGIYWNFFPCLDVVKDVRWGRTYETFGLDTGKVTEMGLAYMEGFQSVRTEGVKSMATPKHYVGLGAMEWGSSDTPGYKMDHGNTIMDEATLRAEHLPPFKAAVQNGALSVMTGLNRWNGEKMSGNKYLITDVLKKESDFRGFVVSDWQGASGLSADECDSWIKAINAGVDMVMLPFEYEKFTACMKDAVRRGDIPASRLDDANARILRAKFAMGLFDHTESSSDFSVIGSAEHRQLAREAVRKSLVLLKNDRQTLPVSKRVSSIVVAGSAADNLGRQAGGWTVEWQGVDGNLISGTTILQGIRKAVSSDTKIEYDKEGNFKSTDMPADIGIAVVGEKPYAEGLGDCEHPALSPEDSATIQKVKNSSKKIAVIIISGRPLDIKENVKEWDAVVAAWLPGSKGEGVSDVLFGDYPFSGKLPVDWSL